MRILIKKEILREIEKKGYKNFKIAFRRGFSVEFCNSKRNIRINVGSAKGFEHGTKKFCLNTTRCSYPYEPTFPVCFDTRDEALSYAVFIMEAVERTGTRYNPGEVIQEIIKEFLENGKASVLA